MKKIINSFIIACLCFTALQVNAESLIAPLNNLTDSIDLLSAIKNANKPVDIIAIQTALNRVIDLSEEEITQLEDQLISLKTVPDDRIDAYNNYLNQLNDLRLHYDTVRNDLNQDISLAEILIIAKNLKIWRQNKYTPTLAPIVTYSIIFQNKDAVETAIQRLASIIKDERKIKNILSRAKWISFIQLIKKAQTAIAHATKLNANAQELLSTNDDSIYPLIDNANRLINESYEYFRLMSALFSKK